MNNYSFQAKKDAADMQKVMAVVVSYAETDLSRLHEHEVRAAQQGVRAQIKKGMDILINNLPT
jgi:hypothetical protein